MQTVVYTQDAFVLIFASRDDETATASQKFKLGFPVNLLQATHRLW
ncbi:hypothetical protein [Methylophilus sp. YYY-1]|nr:hypothetical protein [Methylophilus sp. YYY-1]MDF0378636.1 hypothetical protein [Methylophilus sp. YYY-1]